MYWYFTGVFEYLREQRANNQTEVMLPNANFYVQNERPMGKISSSKYSIVYNLYFIIILAGIKIDLNKLKSVSAAESFPLMRWRVN